MNTRLEQVKNHPLHTYLGVKEIISEEGHGEVHAVVNTNTLNPSGIYHVGVIYTLCDVCAYCGLVSQLDERAEAVTHDIHISILRPAKEHDEVVYKSSIKKLGKSLCFLDVEAIVNEKVIATARATKSIVPNSIERL